MKLFLARHAECDKNLRGIPGGPGSSLTIAGVDQARQLAQRLADQGATAQRIVACPPVQTRETAAIVAKELGLSATVRQNLRSIGLGVLAGIPIEDAKRLHPCSSASMDLWRAGKIELCDVKIKGMESPNVFFGRGVSYVLGLLTRAESEVVIATTSIMILFDNLHRMRGPARGEGYRVIHYQNAELLELSFSQMHRDWLRLQASKYCV